MSEKPFKIDPAADPGMRRAIGWLTQKGGVSAGQLDGAGGHPRDNILSAGELIHFVYNSSDWKKYLPALDQAGLQHPLDDRGLQWPVTFRALSLRKQVEEKIGMTPENSEYCPTFMPEFFAEGLKPFLEGGLGWGYPFGYAQMAGVELTAGESYASVLDPERPFGECTEALYKMITGARAAFVPCELRVYQTQNHVFVRSGPLDMDPSGLGKLGWERPMTDGRVAFVYYSNLAASAEDPVSRERYAMIATAIDPESSLAHQLKVYDLFIKSAGGLASTEEACQEIFRMIDANPENPNVYANALGFLKYLSDEEGLRVARKLMQRHPDSAYALDTFQTYCHARGLLLQEGLWLMANFPESGNGEVLLALQALHDANHGEFDLMIDEALKKNPLNALALQSKGRLLFAQGKPDEAIAYLKDASDRAPNLAGTHQSLSAIYSQKGWVDAAYDEAKRERLVFLDNPSGDMALAQTALAAGDFETAVIYAAQYIKRAPSDPSGYLTLSQALVNQGDLAEAILSAEGAVKLSTLPVVQATMHAWLATLYLMKPDLQKAAEEARLAQEADPNNAMAFIANVQTRIYQGRYADALAVAEKGVQALPGRSSLLALRASLHQVLNHREAARRDVTEALRWNPRDPMALAMELSLALEDGQTEVVEKRLEVLREQFSLQPFIHGIDASVSYLLGDRDRALAESHRALKYDPNGQSALMTLGLIYAEQGDFKAAAALALKLKKFYPFQSDGSLLMAKVLQRQGKLKEAEVEAREAARLFPYDNGLIPKTSVYQTLIEILAASGKTADAATAYTAMMRNRTTPGP